MHNAIDEKMGDKKNLAIGLGNVAIQQLVIGALSAAERNLRRRIDLCREIEDEFREAIGHQELGRVLSYRGEWQEAEQELDKAIELFEKEQQCSMQKVLFGHTAPCVSCSWQGKRLQYSIENRISEIGN